jgi:WD40 repeat protein
VLVWDVRKAKLRQTLPHKTEILALAFSPDGTILATAGADGVGRVWNVANSRLRVALIGHTHYVVGIAFSTDSKYVVTASRDRTARVWDVGGDLRALLAGDSDTVTAASFSPGRRQPLRVLTASDDGSARLWDPQTQPHLRKVKKEPGALLRTFSLDHGLLLVAGPGREVRLLRASDGHLVRVFRVAGKVVDAAVSKDGRFVAVGAGRTAAVFDRGTGRRLHRIRQPSNVEAVALSPAGDLLGTGGSDGIGRIWTLASPRHPQLLRDHSAAITAIAFSPDREHVATGSADAMTRIWDLRTGGSPRTLKRNQDSNPITSVTFSPDPHGSSLLTSSKGTDVVLWNVGTGAQQQLFRWHFGAVSDAAFSPDGRWIVTVGPTTLQLWRPSDRDPLFRLGIAGRGGMTGATFDSNSRTVFAVDKDGQVLTYRCEVCGGLDDLRPLARKQLARTGRVLTRQEQRRFAG